VSKLMSEDGKIELLLQTLARVEGSTEDVFHAVLLAIFGGSLTESHLWIILFPYFKSNKTNQQQ
jgi:hypothetical protein